ncbi:MAG TPA: hypothetical protein VKA63_05905 [Candidatus Krumholzibacteria bacterium]|nr:hypothetical protein [Candidatus Krumholzibacteria bacterium]
MSSSADSNAIEPRSPNPRKSHFGPKYANTEFQFKAANLDFHSSSYQWLVVGGDQAQFKGYGTINGQGNYGFLLTAQDAQLSNGALSADTFRIKIWDVTTGTAVYDNGAQQPIGGGSIVIHK